MAASLQPGPDPLLIRSHPEQIYRLQTLTREVIEAARESLVIGQA